MPIHIEPLASQNILHYRFSGHITLHDMERARMAEDRLYAPLPGEKCLGIIANLADLDTIAASLFPQLQSMRMVTDSRICVVVVVGANPYLRALAVSLGLMSANHEFVFRETEEAALAVVSAYTAP